MPMDDITYITNIAVRRVGQGKKAEVLHGKENRENQVPYAPKMKGGLKPKVQEIEKTHEDKVWDQIRDASLDLTQCWASNCAEKGQWINNALAQFGHFGPHLQAALLSGTTNSPPPPPPVEQWKAPETSQVRPPPQAWPDDAAAEEIQELTAKNLLLGACHEQMEQLRPRAQEIHKVISVQERQKSLLWLSQVCRLHSLDDCVFQECVMLLDRYLATQKEPITMDETLCIAIFGIARKVAGAAGGNCPPMNSLKNLGPEMFQRVLKAELAVLKALDFQTVGHTALDFLESFVFSLERNRPHEQRQVVTPLKCVATFLLQLALGDANLLHRYPYAILAAGAVYVALWCTQAKGDRCQLLMHDVLTAVTPDPDEARFI